MATIRDRRREWVLAGRRICESSGYHGYWEEPDAADLIDVLAAIFHYAYAHEFDPEELAAQAVKCVRYETSPLNQEDEA